MSILNLIVKRAPDRVPLLYSKILLLTAHWWFILSWTLKSDNGGDFGDADAHDDEIDDDGGDGGDTDGEDDEINFELEAVAVDEVSEDEEDRDIDFIRRNDFL